MPFGILTFIKTKHLFNRVYHKNATWQLYSIEMVVTKEEYYRIIQQPLLLLQTFETY